MKPTGLQISLQVSLMQQGSSTEYLHCAAPFDTERMVTISIALVDQQQEMGLPQFATKSHRTAWSGWDIEDSRVQSNFQISSPGHLAAGTSMIMTLGNAELTIICGDRRCNSAPGLDSSQISCKPGTLVQRNCCPQLHRRRHTNNSVGRFQYRPAL